MSDCKKCRSLFTEAFYKELDPEHKDFLESHIQLCKKCKSEFTEMRSTLKIMSQRTRPEPGQEFWDDYGKRLAQRMEKEGASNPVSESWRHAFLRPINLAPRWATQTAAAVLLVITGILIGKLIFSPSVSEIQQARQMPSSVSQPKSGIELIHRTQDYIERSKLILLALVNFDPGTEDPYALNLPYQQQVSRELVQEAGFLKKGLADSDQRRLENLITDLEVILLQIANLESEFDLSTIELVKKGVDSRGILLKINLSDIRQSMEKKNKMIPLKRTSNKT